IYFRYLTSSRSVALYRTSSDLRPDSGPRGSISDDANSQIHRAEETLWLRGFGPIPCGITFSVILTLAIILRSLGRFQGDALRLLLALGVVNVLMMVGTLSLTPYIPRFVLPNCVINAGALAILLGGLDNLFSSRLLSQKRST